MRQAQINELVLIGKTERANLSCPLIRLLLSLAILLFPLASQSAVAGHEILGKWKFTSILDLAELTSLDESQARRLLGHVITISKDGATLDGYRCSPASFAVERVEPNLYLQKDAGINNAKLKLPKIVTVVDIGCANVYVISASRAVIDWRGWFFSAVRMRD